MTAGLRTAVPDDDVTLTITGPDSLLGPIRTLVTVEVDATHLTNALRAALPHAGRNPEATAYERIQVHTRGDHLLVAATDGFTALVAVTPALEPVAELVEFDVLPGDAKALAGLFKPPKDTTVTLRVDVTANHVTVNETALFDGRSLRVPRATPPEGGPPPVPAFVGRWLAADPAARELTVVTADLWRRFAVSAAVYDGVLAVETRPGRGPLTITCGDRFAGLLMPRRSADDTDSDDELREQRDAWLDRLPVETPPGVPL